MTEAKAAIAISDGELSASCLAAETAALLGDRPRMQAMATAARGLARPDAAVGVARVLREVGRR
jgi:UDP-N-acetylglucosamine--N-acetylmuramyl-(pentapeptide) pyrophosphoryl-undecaprenol N-acetylglucosamine transferase